MKILVLTNCIFREKMMEEQFHLLGYEVFISQALLTESLTMVRFFDVILLSDTLPADQQIIIAKKLLSFKVPIMKITCDESITLNGIFEGIIDPEWDVEEMGNKLAAVAKLKKRVVNEQSFLHAGKKEVQDINFYLSKMEKKLLNCLKEAEGEIVSKEDISLYLWEGEPTASRLCHVSNLVKHVREKIERYQSDWYRIITVWGQGYYLQTADGWEEPVEEISQETTKERNQAII
ncbi:DNA-binding response regulator [Enterococcus pallens]|uniref:OmpR/PhoB-type domain-containing protein n=1 Tax=Enterococcus pallens ATCC BAA-351 TaxID=1158607 RepID=R2QB66_9ENTE|nr:winged helix family transcriptional regulator [Enterococcus pallens]EOH93687.1 hypothetical protein UAU_02383 [Enterococcus pallens ATCC BAA-351]EOU24527.1 hypothetical protein I588_00514 [Enterococcus pallens ATCC BAA-351]OJG78585.1 hypothetical protein RV10_GL001367 [Enterococcus pallens]